MVFMFESFADRFPVLGIPEFLWVKTGEVVGFPLVVEEQLLPEAMLFSPGSLFGMAGEMVKQVAGGSKFTGDLLLGLRDLFFEDVGEFILVLLVIRENNPDVGVKE